MDGIRESIAEILQDVSGETIDPAATLTFLELGFDSLLLSQVAQQNSAPSQGQNRVPSVARRSVNDPRARALHSGGGAS